MVRIEMSFNAMSIYFVRITTDASDASDPKVERRQHILATFSISKSGFFEIRHDKTAEAAVDVKTNVIRGSQGTEGDYVVLVAVWKVYGGAYELKYRLKYEYVLNTGNRNITRM